MKGFGLREEMGGKVNGLRIRHVGFEAPIDHPEGSVAVSLKPRQDVFVSRHSFGSHKHINGS